MMGGAMRFITAALLVAITTFTTAFAVENTWDPSVQVSATVQTAPARITLSWPQDTNATPSSYTIYRKSPASTDWGSGTTIAGSSTSYSDTNISAGAAYEYRIVKAASAYTGYGYITAGVQASLVDSRGKVVLVVDNSFTASLSTELARLEQDLRGDGWTVVRRDVARNATPASVKGVIKAVYDSDPANVKSVFLFGHVPVPYSGQLNPDGHPDHIGAWPADAYYGDMDGNWTDSSINYTQTINTDPADRARISNVPGDGKFDQSTLPSAIELEVGRVDLANMPVRLEWGGPATVANETELLRKYLNKDNNFRHRRTNTPRRAMIGDYFGFRGGEAFAASAFRSFAPLVGASNVRNLGLETNDARGVWIPHLAQNDYLLAFGCGAGSYDSISGIGNTGLYNTGYTPELVQNNTRSVFTLLFGSWLGDWDHEDNIMRSTLLTDTGLAAVWSGRPHWFMHPLGLGSTLGEVTRLTQNNRGQYQTIINSSENRIHVALMGDPTLRLHPVAPAGNLTGSVSGSTVSLSWAASNDSNIVGYHVYRASSATGTYARLTSSPTTATNYSDNNATSGATYMIRAVKLETASAGSYYNAAQGIFYTVGGSNPTTPPPAPATDSTAPTIAVSAPAASATVSGSVNVTASASDNVAVTGVQFKLDGANLGSEVTASPFATSLNTTTLANGTHTLSAVARDAAGNIASANSISITVNNLTSTPSTSTGTGDTGTTTTTPPVVAGPPGTGGNFVWIDDALPAGAGGVSASGDTWNWVSSSPAPYSGSKAHKSDAATGKHEHWFGWSGQTMMPLTGEVLFTYVYLDPANPPSEIMLSWNSTNWEHRAYWGGNHITNGTDKTESRFYMGPLPATGQWVRLEVPAKSVGLENATINSMGFAAYNGSVTWDYSGKAPASTPPLVVIPAVTVVATDATAIPGSTTDNAVLTFTRTGSTASPLVVPFTLSGTAQQWNDYYRAPEGDVPVSVTIPSGASSTSINIAARSTATSGSTAIFTLTANSAYDTSSQNKATVTFTSTTSTPSTSTPTTGTPTTSTPTTTTPPTTSPSNGETIWFDDALPAGAGGASANGGDGWTWVSSNPTPISGTKAHQSNIASGLHEHYFGWSNAPLAVATGDTLFAYVYLDPANMPTEIMLSWSADNWEHRAYWGADSIDRGAKNSAGRYKVGQIPAGGQWVRLEVPASAVGLAGSNVNAMGFSLVGGRATWDKTGKFSGTSTPTTSTPTTTTPTAPTTTTSTVDTIWFDDALPAGAGGMSGSGGDSWNWVAANPTPVSGTLAHQSNVAAGLHEHWFGWSSAPMAVAAGDKLFAYVYIDPANKPTEIMISWCADNWEHRAFWGADKIDRGAKKSASRYEAGAMPVAGQWVRLEVPASAVGLEGKTVSSMGFAQVDGRATWDKTGKAVVTTTTTPGSTTSTPTAPAVTAVDTLWIDDALPAGAGGASANGGDAWDWVTSSPTPFSGTKAHKSAVAAGAHEHWFGWSSATLAVNTGDKLFAYVYLDPANLPTEIMLSWSTNTSWDQRAYWGSNKIDRGTNGTASRFRVGDLPAAGQWVRLEVPASAVGLEGKTITAMSFGLFDGGATWDAAGKSSLGTSTSTPTTETPTTTTPTTTTPTTTTPTTPTTTTPPVVTIPTTPTTTTPTPSLATAENQLIKLPNVGDYQLRVLTPTLLELQRITLKQPDPAPLTEWNFVDGSGNFNAPATSQFAVTVAGQTVNVTSVGFRRRVAYATEAVRDLRVDNCLFLTLATPITDGQDVEVKNPSGALWPATMKFALKADALRNSPAIHVNQEGYMPNFVKKAMVGYYLGNKGEMDINAAAGFKIVTASTGVTVHSGSLTLRKDVGYSTSPLPHQKVYEADFSSFNAPGEYQLVVPGLGASLPFLINDGMAMSFARTYALGLYHQRCGHDNAMPYTRFIHAACHLGQAEVPTTDSAFDFTWYVIGQYAGDAKNNPRHTAPAITKNTMLYPFVNTGRVDVAGGHHDAGDYSKYTTNVSHLVHLLTFTADSVQGAGSLDNLGIPQSGDGTSDVLQEAKQESDFLAKMQDADGGFYFLVYPKNREYESNVMPQHGDAQVVWPKTTIATAAAVGALAEIGSSPAFKAKYPAEAAAYLQKAKLGWTFLTNAIAQHGKDGSYQKITHYGAEFMHDDELIWAAAALFAATGEQQYHTKLKEWFPDPSDQSTFRWSWIRMFESYGNAVRCYAFAARSGRLSASQLDAAYLLKCEQRIKAAGEDVLRWTKESAYGTNFNDASKRIMVAGWYFSLDWAADMAVAYQLDPKQDYVDAIISNMNYEAGSNPVNVSFVTGLGLKRQHEVVNQFSNNDHRMLAPSGIPIGNIAASYSWVGRYGTEQNAMSFPADGGSGSNYPLQERWADNWNVTAEFVTVNQARALLASTMVAAKTVAKSTAWKSAAVTPKINAAGTAAVGQPITLSLDAAGLDLANARIVWEARDQRPDFGSTYTVSPKNTGAQWVEVEITWPDGRRAFATGSFNVQ
jgi:hypothetical protein